jgi:hypothetical protein
MTLGELLATLEGQSYIAKRLYEEEERLFAEIDGPWNDDPDDDRYNGPATLEEAFGIGPS